jgi:hypothetical protein
LQCANLVEVNAAEMTHCKKHHARVSPFR